MKLKLASLIVALILVEVSIYALIIANIRPVNQEFKIIPRNEHSFFIKVGGTWYFVEIYNQTVYIDGKAVEGES